MVRQGENPDGRANVVRPSGFCYVIGMTDAVTRETIPLKDAFEESGIRRATAFEWVRKGLVEVAPKVPGDQRTYVYRDSWMRQAAKPRRRGRRKAEDA
jgi:hypothetical protein